MRSSFAFFGTIATVAAIPAAVPAIDLNAVLAAITPATGPPSGITAQSAVYNPTSAAAAASAGVLSGAAASATASVAARDLDGGLEKRGALCIFGWCYDTKTGKWVPQSSYNASQSGTTVVATATTPTATSTVIPIVAAVTSALPTVIVPTTCTPISWTNTNAFITTDTACPTPYEVGTYCGFINPEDPCAPQPIGNAVQVSPDTLDGFQGYAPFHQAAQKAVTPTGYANTFKDLNASVSANSYLGLYTFSTYDVAGCAAQCDNTNLCTAFNIYVERNPSINPDQCSCDTFPSLSNYKCTLWGSGVEPAAANNFGQWRGSFQVVIAASNGYEKSNTTAPTTPSGWNNPKNCSGSVHNHGSTCIGQKFFPGPFDVSVCASYASAQNAKNKNVFASWWAQLTGYNPSKCNFFNAYMLKQNGVAKGTYCSLFAQQYDPTQATYQPGWSNGKYWGVESSWSFCSASK